MAVAAAAAVVALAAGAVDAAGDVDVDSKQEHRQWLGVLLFFRFDSFWVISAMVSFLHLEGSASIIPLCDGREKRKL